MWIHFKMVMLMALFLIIGMVVLEVHYCALLGETFVLDILW